MRKIKYIKHIEAKDYINISPYSRLNIGKELSPGNIHDIYDMKGKPLKCSLRTYIEYSVMKDYPVDYLYKEKLTDSDIEYIKTLSYLDTDTDALMNIVYHIVIYNFMKKDKLLEHMYNSIVKHNLIITSFIINDKNDGSFTLVYNNNLIMELYVDALNLIRDNINIYKSIIDKFN